MDGVSSNSRRFNGLNWKTCSIWSLYENIQRSSPMLNERFTKGLQHTSIRDLKPRSESPSGSIKSSYSWKRQDHSRVLSWKIRRWHRTRWSRIAQRWLILIGLKEIEWWALGWNWVTQKVNSSLKRDARESWRVQKGWWI